MTKERADLDGVTSMRKARVVMADSKASSGSFVQAFIARFQPAAETSEISISSQFMDPKNFSAQLDLERARTDRTGSPFALVVFDLADSENACTRDEFTNLIAKTIAKRKRASDVLGWYESSPKRVGLLLGNITQQQTSNVIQEIESLFRSRLLAQDFAIHDVPPLECDVYLYPSPHELFEDPVSAENLPQFSMQG